MTYIFPLALGEQMRPLRMFKFSAVAVLAALSIVACSETAGPEGETQDFSGSYTLHEFFQGTVSNVTVFQGTGTFTMTATTYHISIEILGGAGALDDNGTYTATGTATSGDFTQQSTDDPSLQYQGTYAWDASTNRLTLDTNAQGMRTVLVLQRT